MEPVLDREGEAPAEPRAGASCPADSLSLREKVGVRGEVGVIPPKQQPYILALDAAFDALIADPPSAARLAALGAEQADGAIYVPVLNRRLLVCPEWRTVVLADGKPARTAWALLALHYLAARDVSVDNREVSLSHFSDSRGYLAVFNKRIVGRFLATSGKTREGFAERSEAIGGELAPSTGLAYRFRVLPRVPVVIVRFDGDAEMGPGASVVYRADAENLLPAEDRIVAAELLLDTLSNVPIHEASGGPHERRS